MEDSSSEYMDDCCPSLCYFCCSCCKADENPVLWQNWADVRSRLYWFVETKCFRITIAMIIIFSVTILVSYFRFPFLAICNLFSYYFISILQTDFKSILLLLFCRFINPLLSYLVFNSTIT